MSSATGWAGPVLVLLLFELLLEPLLVGAAVILPASGVSIGICVPVAFVRAAIGFGVLGRLQKPGTLVVETVHGRLDEAKEGFVVGLRHVPLVRDAGHLTGGILGLGGGGPDSGIRPGKELTHLLYGGRVLHELVELVHLGKLLDQFEYNYLEAGELHLLRLTLHLSGVELKEAVQHVAGDHERVAVPPLHGPPGLVHSTVDGEVL
ncbi:MAG: hypothetical protein ACPH2J_10385 [Akkermansiaceae bacterium]